MAEMVASAVVGETVSRISTVLVDQSDQRSNERDDMERLEMAHIKMEAALHMSDRWQITDVPMLLWRSKLKRTAQECDDTLRHRRKQRALEDEEARRSSSFPRRIVRAAKSFVASFSTGATTSSSSANIRRFERFAEGTSEFLKFVEFGGRRYTFFNPLIGDLLAGKTLHYQALRGDKFYYLRVRPMTFADRGVEAMVGFACKDLEEPAKSFNLGLMLRLSESSDVFGIIIKCMQSTAAAPHFIAAAENTRRELIQLPSQDFSWVAHPPHGEEEYWTAVHSTTTQWFRPNPLCCNEHADPVTCSSSNITNAPMYPEEVIVVYLRCRISLSTDGHQSRQNSATQHGRKRSRRSCRNSGSAPLKLGLLFIPHFSPEGIEAAESYAYEVIDGDGQGIVHRNASLRDVDEVLLPKAVHHLSQNSESRMYQMCLRSRHGSAHLCVEKMIAQVPSKTAQSQSQKSVDQSRKNTVTQKVIEAIRALAGARGKEQIDIGDFGFSATELAALGEEPHYV